MQAVLSLSGPRRWLVPVALGVVVPLIFVTLPGTPARTLAEDTGLARDVGGEIAALNSVRIGFLQARLAERDAVPGEASQAHAAAVSGIRRTLDSMRDGTGGVSGDMAALRAAIDRYAQAVTSTATPDQATEMLPKPPPADAIDAMLGQLRTQDEALLREPLLDMRLAEMAIRPGGDAPSARRLSRSAEIFAARLDEMAIPVGTRASLARKIAAYEHDALSENDVLFQEPTDAAIHQAVSAVETAMANADGALTARQQLVTDASDTARARLRWLLGAALGISALVMAACGFAFGRTAAFEHPMSGSTPSR